MCVSVSDLGASRVGHGLRPRALLGPRAQEVKKYIIYFQIKLCFKDTRSAALVCLERIKMGQKTVHVQSTIAHRYNLRSQWTTLC